MYLYEFLNDEYKKISLKTDINNLSGKTFFVTGANGLIGSNIVNYIHYLNKTNNLNIKIIAHSFSKPVTWLPEENDIQYLTSDLNEELPKIKFDFLIHTATYGQPKKFVQNKLGTIQLNTQTYIKLLDLCKINNAKVLFLSSSEIYGQIPEHELPVKESYFGNVDSTSQRAVYAESKRIAETISTVYKEDGLDIKIVRLGIAYGPGIKYSDSRFINEFIKKAINDKSIKMMDKGEAKRCFCFITDTIEMMLNTLFSSKEYVYNLSGLDNKTVKETAEIIAQITKTKVEYPQQEEKIGGTPSAILISNQKYVDEFQKKEFIDFRTGLEKTVSWLNLLHPGK